MTSCEATTRQSSTDRAKRQKRTWNDSDPACVTSHARKTLSIKAWSAGSRSMCDSKPFLTSFSFLAQVATSAMNRPKAVRSRRSSGLVSSFGGFDPLDSDDAPPSGRGDCAGERPTVDDERLREPFAALSCRSRSFICKTASWKWSYAKPSCAWLRRPVVCRLRIAVRLAKVSMETRTSDRKRLRSDAMVSSVMIENSRKATTTVYSGWLAVVLMRKRSERTQSLELGDLPLSRIVRVGMRGFAKRGKEGLQDAVKQTRVSRPRKNGSGNRT